MKQILPWILMIAFGVTSAALFSGSQKKDLELATLRGQVQELENRMSESESGSGRKTEVDPNELERLRKDGEEVYKLRNQVAQLQKRINEMPVAMPETPQPDYQQPPQQDDPTAVAQEIPAEDPVTKQQREQCVENMKVVEEAKTMWAVANEKQAGDRMTIADITTALPNGSMPLCPSGGVYMLNEVGIPASCSIPAHSLLP